MGHESRSICDRFGALASIRLDRRSFVRYTALAAGSVVSVPLLAACGGDDDDETETATSTTTSGAEATGTTVSTDDATPTTDAVASPTSADASPTSGDASPTTGTGSGFIDGGDRLMGKTIEEAANTGGTLIEGSILDLRSLNPILFNDEPSFSVGFLIFEVLVEVNPDTLEPVGNLASGWEVSDDSLTWTMYLREGVTWQDGETFDAEDVKFTYETYLNPESGSNQTSTLASKLESVEIVDPMTVQFNLLQPVADFLLDVGGVFFLMIAEHIWRDVPAGDIQQHPGSTGADPSLVIGTGPFIFQEWITGDHVTLVKNENYWDGTPHLDEYIFKIVPDVTSAVQQMKTGEIDWFNDLQGALVAEFDDSEDITVFAFPQLSFIFYGTQLDPEKSTKFQDVRVRQALLYAIDRQAIVDQILFGYSEVAVGTIPSLSWAFNPDGIDPALLYEYDPDRARELLDEAGWLEGSDGVREMDGEQLAFTMYGINSSEQDVQTLTAYQEFWAEIGVAMTPSPEPFQQLVSRLTETFDFEAFLVGFGWGPTPDQSPMWACDSYGVGFNIVKYCNPEVDELLSEALSELDRERRIELYTEFQNVLLADLPMAVTDFPQGLAPVSNRIHNLFPSSQNDRFNAETWWIDQ